VPDGTEVFFFTDLGRVDASGKTVNGVARVNFVSDSRSGVAHVTGISGGPAPSPPTTTTTLASSPFSQPLAFGTGVNPGAAGIGARAPTLAASTSIAAGQNSDMVDITIGSALPALVLVSADPQRIRTPGNSRLTATVFDAVGNPVQNVPVSFSISEGDPVEERLDSGGALLYTNANGQVFDVLRTQALPGFLQKPVIVTATTATDVKGSVTVFID
jgi:hypothetical protein